MRGRVISYQPDPDSHLHSDIYRRGLGQFSICLRDSNSDNDGEVRRDNTPSTLVSRRARRCDTTAACGDYCAGTVKTAALRIRCAADVITIVTTAVKMTMPTVTGTPGGQREC